MASLKKNSLIIKKVILLHYFSFRDMNLDLAKSYETVMIALNCLRTVLGEVKSTKMYHVAELAVSTVIFSIERMGFVLKQESSRQGEIKKHVQCLAETLSNWCHWILQNTKLTRTFKRNGNAYTELGDQFELKVSWYFCDE